MNACANNEGPTLEAIRERLRGMTDAQLREHGEALLYMNSPQASYGETLPTYGLQLAEARAEWKRRKALTPAEEIAHPVRKS